ncbi:MAG: methyl-accepting chemotaxis protein [Hyphomicrobiaceae bacterium]
MRAEAEAAAHEHARVEAAKRAQAEQREAEAAAIRVERQTVAMSFGTALKKLASKDLTYRLSGQVPEAYVQLQADFNAAVSQVEEALHEVQQSAEAITVGAGQISTASDDLSQRTEQQAAKLENSSVVLIDIARQIEATAADAGAANKVVQSTTDAMTGIADSSSKISAIVGIIDAIAFQTNMLALNAAVEAARAGDVGKGFAVVATEVRALAQRSAGAASEIKTLIQTSAGQVDAGVRMVDETSRVLGQILREVSEASIAVERIVAANHEQAAKVKSVSAAVSELDTMTQQNAAMAEQATGASQSLRGETERLNHLIQVFEVGLNPADVRGARPRPVPSTTRQAAVSKPGTPQRRRA